MFTDDVEVQYRHKINPQLCMANIPEKFPSSNKVFIFAKTNKGQELNKLFNYYKFIKSSTRTSKTYTFHMIYEFRKMT